MRKSILILLMAVFAGSTLFAAPKKLFFDNFKLPLKRTCWLKFPAADEAWQQEFKLESSGLRWLVRTSGNPADITDFKVYNGNGKIIMQTKTLKKFDWVNFHGPFPYTVKVSGKAHAKPISIALDAHDNEDPKLPVWKSVQMFSWYLLNSTAASTPENLTELTPKEKKVAYLRGELYDCSSKKKYRAEITVVSKEAQQVTFSAIWKGGRKTDKAGLLPGVEQKLTVEFQPSVPHVSLQLSFNGKIQLKKFYLWEE